MLSRMMINIALTLLRPKDTYPSDSSIGSSSSNSGRVIEISVRKQLAEQSLSCLRMYGFNRSDIYRMLEKGPWVLAFDISGVLPRLVTNIKVLLTVSHAVVYLRSSVSSSPRSSFIW